MRRIWYISGLAAMLTLTGCEWDSSSDGSSWSDQYNWLNFSGTYRATDGGTIVRGIATNPGGTTTVSRENKGTTDGSSTYSFSTQYTPLVATSVSVTIGNKSWSDNGNGTMVGEGGGEVNYQTGAVTVRGATGLAQGQVINVDYLYQRETVGDEPLEPLDHDDDEVEYID